MSDSSKSDNTSTAPKASPATANAITAALAKAKGASVRERARIASDATRIARQERVVIESMGLEFDVRPMPSGATLDVFAAAQQSGMPSATAYYVSLIQGSTYEPDTDNLAWPADAKAEVWALAPEIFGPLQAAAQRVNAATKEADAALGNASGETAADDSSSVSPAI